MKLFLKFELEKIVRYYKTKTTAKLITTLLFLGVFFFIALGIYGFFVTGFRYINAEDVEGIRLALTLFLYEVFLLIFAGIIVFSTLVSGLFNLFRGDINNWVISSPGYRLFPRVVLIRSLFSSVLPLLVIFLPAVLAFNKVYGLGILTLLFITVSVGLLITLLNALTLSLVTLVGYLYYKISSRIPKLPFNFKGLVVLLFTLITVLVLTVWKVVSAIDLGKIFKAEEIDGVVGISNITVYFNLLPTHPLAMEIISWQTKDLSTALSYFVVLFVLTTLVSTLWWFGSSIFYGVWQKLQEGASNTAVKASNPSRFARVYQFTGSVRTVLFKKEALVLSRNLKGVLWFLFLFSIWVLQLATNVFLGNNVAKYETNIAEKIATVQAFQYIIAIYFISAFTLRFVFPAFSVEKKSAWILASAPLSFKKIFIGKYFFYASFFVILGLLMSYANSVVLGASFLHALYSLALLVVTITFIVTLGLSMGALFPSIETDDAESATTSMSGLFFTAFSLIYGAVSAWVLYVTLSVGTVSMLYLFVFASLVAIVVSLLKIPKIVGEKRLG